MSSKWCTTSNKDWQVPQTSVCSGFVNIGKALQDTRKFFQKCRECGCESCIEDIGYLQKRIGPLVETIGSYHKELTEIIGYITPKKEK